MPEKKYISSIKQNNETYALKDNEARDSVDTLMENAIKCRMIEDDTLEFYNLSYRTATSSGEELTSTNNEKITTLED